MTKDMEFVVSPEAKEGVVTWVLHDIHIRISGVPLDLTPGRYKVEFVGATKKGIDEPETIHYKFVGKEDGHGSGDPGEVRFTTAESGAGRD